MPYQPHLHHRRSIRLQGYDYAQAGLYFITLCCQHRAHLFGHINNGEMHLNEYGRIAAEEWQRTPTIRPQAILHEFVIMPNHMHAILQLSFNAARTGVLNTPRTGVSHTPGLHTPGLHTPEFHTPEFHTPDLDNGVFQTPGLEKGVCNTPQTDTPEIEKGVCNTPRQQLQSPSQTVGAIIRGYKAAVTKQLNALLIGQQVWQRNYHEHIIRSEAAYLRIAQYIINNPAKWTADSLR